MTVSASVNLPPMTLTIIGSKGTTVVLNQTSIGNLTSYRAVGGRINKVGTMSGLGNYTGVPINTFCQMVGGLHLGQTLRVTGSGNYVLNFTYAQVNGNWTTYGSNGNKVQHNQSLTTILAYYFNGKNLTSGGPLRFAIVGPEGLYTTSSYWVQGVSKLEILGTAEYNLTVGSLPTGVSFTVNGTSYTTSWSGIYNDGSSVNLVMPGIASVGGARYYWNRWSDGNTSESRTVSITGNTTLTAEYTGPYYVLTVSSSPVAGVSFTINGTAEVTPYSGWLLGGSYTVVMPGIASVGGARYYWSQWIDGDTSESRIVTMNTNITLTADYTGPYYQLTVTSSPVAGVSFTINGTAEVTPYSGWLLGGSYTLVMPETFNNYVWLHWLQDGDTSKTKIITLTGNTTWTGVFSTPPPVGGYSIPLNIPINTSTKANALTFDLLISAILAPIFITVTRRKRCRKKT
jgi:hypothetical protein